MKVKVNRNILWAETFAAGLVSHGVKYACISPGSRSTPLTLSFAKNKNIKCFVHIDERSAAFFALGLAKAAGAPVALITTSGTATAEMYPAIIEAFQDRVPLIVCTADRPPELLNRGTNQTINQENIYKNHIRWYANAGLPGVTEKKINQIKALATRAVNESMFKSKGPVHLNFPFRKPFEPDNYTDEVTPRLIKLSESKPETTGSNLLSAGERKNSESWTNKILKLCNEKRKGLIVVGPNNLPDEFKSEITALAENLNYPVLADGASQLRFGSQPKKYIITNYDSFLRSGNFIKNNTPELVLQFGRTPTSKALIEYFKTKKYKRYLINDFGDLFDPSRTADGVIAADPAKFCRSLNLKIRNKISDEKREAWRQNFLNADKIVSHIKSDIIYKAKFPDESRVIIEALNAVPDNSKIMISNSLPVRDLDNFAELSDKRITVFTNRGASGIDGITSTALGAAALSNQPVFLITGDTAFYHDLNGLLAAKKYSIPLVIILINNNGGGIFEALPVSKYGKIFREYFTAPNNLRFEPFVKGYGGNYTAIKNWNHIRAAVRNAVRRKNFSVLEINTNAKESQKLRIKFWRKVSKQLQYE